MELLTGIAALILGTAAIALLAMFGYFAIIMFMATGEWLG